MITSPLLLNARIIAVILSLPVAGIIISVLVPTGDVWSHLFDTTLSVYIRDSAVLAIGVILGTALIGGICSLLCSLYDFPGRGFFSWGLILPLAFPVYITGYAYTDMFSFGGWGYQWAFDMFGHTLPVRSTTGATIIFVFALYPYVYLLARSALKQQSAHLLQVAQALGLSAPRIMIRLIIPTIRPAVIAACMLVMMETLSDYAAVQHFGVQTMSVGIFKTWFGLGSLAGAAQLSLLLLCFTVGIVMIEKQARKRMRYYGAGKQAIPIERQQLSSSGKLLAVSVCALPIVIGFVLPMLQLIRWLSLTNEASYQEYIDLALQSVVLGTGTALLVTALAILLAYGDRLRQRPYWLTRIATAGYAIPGVIVAVGVLLAGFVLQEALNFFTQTIGVSSPTLLIAGTLGVLFFAYTVRFMTLGFNAIENSLLKISPNIDYAATVLNVHGLESVRKVHMPLIRPGMLVAALLVFVDVVKEVPMTLILRPFNFNTLAVHAYELASTERLSEMGLPALSIVLTSTLALIILWRFGMRYFGHQN